MGNNVSHETMNYPEKTGYVSHSETSRDSARKLDESGNAKGYDDRIMKILAEAGVVGATAEEARKIINADFPHVHNGSINGRMSTLWRRKEIVKTSLKRKTDAKKDAHVYVLNQFRAHYQALGQVEPEYSEVRGSDSRLNDEYLKNAMTVLQQGKHSVVPEFKHQKICEALDWLHKCNQTDLLGAL